MADGLPSNDEDDTRIPFSKFPHCSDVKALSRHRFNGHQSFYRVGFYCYQDSNPSFDKALNMTSSSTVVIVSLSLIEL
ncbi:hypothetical protein TNCV_3083611 [Trichonephila clavipes]|nr:hypothetical protein TNCV_3083611 [Trichonephila clavipes]